MKLNVDTPIIDKFTALVVVVQDEKGEVISAWARQYVLCDPMQTKATVILWALQLVQVEEFHKIIVKAWKEMLKHVFDALKSSLSNYVYIVEQCFRA